MNQEEFGKHLRSLRKAKKLTLVELSKESGVSNPYISQIENGKFLPSPDILSKLAEPLGKTSFELMQFAGFFKDEEQQKRESDKFFNSMSPEAMEDYVESQIRQKVKDLNIKQYQEKIHVRLEDFLDNDNRYFYIDDHKLSTDDIKMLIALYGGKEKNYPTRKQIEEEYEEIKRKHAENKRKIDSGEVFLILDKHHDINTNEDN